MAAGLTEQGKAAPGGLSYESQQTSDTEGRVGQG